MYENDVSLDHFSIGGDMRESSFEGQWLRVVLRAEQLMRFFLSVDESIEEDRFGIKIRSLKDKKFESIEMADSGVESIFVVTIRGVGAL